MMSNKNMDKLTATRREWSELYTFFALLAQGKIEAGNDTGGFLENVLPIAMVQREEYDGTRKYIVEPEYVHVLGANIDRRFPREDFATIAKLILDQLRKSHENEIDAPRGAAEFLEALDIYDMEALTQDRTDLYLAFYTCDTPLVGFRIHSRLCTMMPLLDGGRTANLKFEQIGVRFSQPAVNKINYTEDPQNPNEVARRILYVESIGGSFKYSDVADKIFRSNLFMIDLHFPRILAEMTRIMHLDNITKVDELTAIIEERNPLKIKDELIHKHGYYRYKMKQFLLALALGMRSTKQYNGCDSAVSGFIMVDALGKMLCYHKNDRETFANYLFYNTRLEKGIPEKDKYGYLERENRLYYLKLNLKIGFTKK